MRFREWLQQNEVLGMQRKLYGHSGRPFVIMGMDMPGFLNAGGSKRPKKKRKKKR